MNVRIFKIIASITVILIFGGLFMSCSKKNTNEPAPITIGEGENKITLTPGYQFIPPEKGDLVAVMKTSMGDIHIKLFPEKAPKTVENFTTHAKNGYYDNVIFHRVIDDFMIQGGDPTGTGRGGESIWGGSFEDEFDIDLLNYRGALSMANTGQPGTNTSQFFIVQKKNMDNLLDSLKMYYPEELVEYYKNGGTPWLDFKHTVFGQVYEGMDVVDKIAQVKTDENHKPLEDVVIYTVEIMEYEN